MIKIVLFLIVASLASLACIDAVSGSGVLEKTPVSVKHRLRRSVDDLHKEERAVSWKSVSAVVPLTKAYNSKMAAALAKRIERRKVAMLEGKLPSARASEFTSYFLAGKSMEEIVNIMKVSGRSGKAIKKDYKAWLKSVLKQKITE
ncbi:hypothetical protein GN958_ATG12704 [Phytophthora infestans]|uniref:Secreted RxLR effector peptide protein n=1 Tax=Phytophthora infestans TaxID=4787 RepID=A0A8S9UAG2_PHYIN|nr:hypothetical protein GN958_ATG12704 [Phytophthora infestans]